MGKATKALFFLILALAGFFFDTSAQKSDQLLNDSTRWRRLGVITINPNENTSEILVLKSQKYSYLRFKTTESRIRLSSIEIFFETGNNQYIELDLIVEPQRMSQPIEVMGGDRRLMKVSFFYNELSNQKNYSSIQLWGLSVSPDN